jgi:hypothetical protein
MREDRTEGGGREERTEGGGWDMRAESLLCTPHLCGLTANHCLLHTRTGAASREPLQETLRRARRVGRRICIHHGPHPGHMGRATGPSLRYIHRRTLH